MNIKEFKKRKNRQNPDFCYSYEKEIEDKKYTIFTMDGGKTFLADIEGINSGTRYLSKTLNSAKECLSAFNDFISAEPKEN